MTEEILLVAGMLASLLSSAVIWIWLRLPLRQLLDQLCDRPGSTELWSRYLLLMLVIAPLVVVIVFAPLEPGKTLESLRQVALAVLLGQFGAFAVVGRSLLKAVRQAAEADVQRRMPDPG